jgi:hypothetical protein
LNNNIASGVASEKYLVFLLIQFSINIMEVIDWNLKNLRKVR